MLSAWSQALSKESLGGLGPAASGLPETCSQTVPMPLPLPLISSSVHTGDLGSGDGEPALCMHSSYSSGGLQLRVLGASKHGRARGVSSNAIYQWVHRVSVMSVLDRWLLKVLLG